MIRGATIGYYRVINEGIKNGAPMIIPLET